MDIAIKYNTLSWKKDIILKIKILKKKKKN